MMNMSTSENHWHGMAWHGKAWLDHGNQGQDCLSEPTEKSFTNPAQTMIRSPVGGPHEEIVTMYSTHTAKTE
jgi:hypothetical protein